jgi:hypothetical protein
MGLVGPGEGHPWRSTEIGYSRDLDPAPMLCVKLQVEYIVPHCQDLLESLTNASPNEIQIN